MILLDIIVPKRRNVWGKKFVQSLCLRKKKFCRQVGLTSVYDSYNLLLKLDKLGFQPSKQGRQEFLGLKIQSIIVKTYYYSWINWDSKPASKGGKSSWTETLACNSDNALLYQDKLGFQPSKQGRQEFLGLKL